MLYFDTIKPDILPFSSLALGFFDGIHLGHQKVILDAVMKSKKIDSISTVVTFKNPPRSVICESNLKLITDIERKLTIFEDLGVQAVCIIDFTKELAHMPANEYLKKILIDCLHPKTITVGYNHHFGANKQGNDEFLKSRSQQYGYEVSVISPISVDGIIVSSSAARNYIAEGNFIVANRLLGRPFTVENTVIKGDQRGRTLGFPTANIKIPENIINPAEGVYAGIIGIDNDNFPAVINVGKRPTFCLQNEIIVEAHILNFNRDIYGKKIEVQFIEKIRDEIKFSSAEELIDRIKQDCSFAENKYLLMTL